jgi:hypothetical protein
MNYRGRMKVFNPEASDDLYGATDWSIGSMDRDRDANNGFRTIVTLLCVGLVLGVVIVICALVIFAIRPAGATEVHPFDAQHFASSKDQKDYFNGLTNGDVTPNEGTGRGGLCCSFADGKRLTDPDWTSGIEIKGEKCVYAIDDERNHRTGSKYCVRLEGVWYVVPDVALVQQPNRIGAAEVWPMMSSPQGGAVIVTRIRCFMPGTLG